MNDHERLRRLINKLSIEKTYCNSGVHSGEWKIELIGYLSRHELGMLIELRREFNNDTI